MVNVQRSQTGQRSEGVEGLQGPMENFEVRDIGKVGKFLYMLESAQLHRRISKSAKLARYNRVLPHQMEHAILGLHASIRENIRFEEYTYDRS